jgi:cold-shock-like DNA binding protein
LVFVHISAVEKAGLSVLNEGQTVEYEEVSNRGKTLAKNLKVKWSAVAQLQSLVPILAPLPLHGDAGGIANLDPREFKLCVTLDRVIGRTLTR